MVAATRIWIAEKIAALAKPLVAEHHPELEQARILWLLSTARPTNKGRPLIMVPKKLSPELRFMSSGLESVEDGYDYVVTFSDIEWQRLNDAQRAAAIDHALCSMLRREKTNKRTGKVTVTWAVRGPDVSEFTEVLERHGLWNKTLERFVKVGGFQLGLPAEAVMEVALPASRTTTVDGSGVVVETELEEPIQTKFKPYEERSSEELAAGHPDGDWEEDPRGPEFAEELANACMHGHSPEECIVCAEERRGQLIGEVDENPLARGPRAEAPEPAEPPKAPTREEVLADLDRRAEALDAQSTEASVPDSWRKRVGMGLQRWNART